MSEVVPTLIPMFGSMHQVDRASALPYAQVFSHGTMTVGMYLPRLVDRQQPHTRDEMYIVASGTGWFRCGDQFVGFGAGDVLFAPAGSVHRFEEFGDDLSVWVVFYGPEGGETNAKADE